MSFLNSTGDRLRRATQLWHAYLAATGQRFELAQFLRDPAIEKQTLDGALASGDSNSLHSHRIGCATPARRCRRRPHAQRRDSPGRQRIPPRPRSRRDTSAVFANWRFFGATPQKKRRANARRFH